MRLAELLKGSGARYRIEHAPDLMRTRMQTGLREVWDFLLRGMLGGVRCSLALAALTVAVGYAFVVAPAIIAAACLLASAAGASGGWLNLLPPTAAVWAIQVFALLFVCKKYEVPAGYAFTTPLGLSLFYTALLVSAVNVVRGKGVAWKGRRVYGRAAGEARPGIEGRG